MAGDSVKEALVEGAQAPEAMLRGIKGVAAFMRSANGHAFCHELSSPKLAPVVKEVAAAAKHSERKGMKRENIRCTREKKKKKKIKGGVVPF